jgi:cell division septation protein DedD
MVFVFFLLVCLFLWMFVLGVWFGERLVGKRPSPVAEKTLKEKIPEEVPAEEVTPPPVALPGNLTASREAPSPVPERAAPVKEAPPEVKPPSPSPKAAPAEKKTAGPAPPGTYYVLQVASFRDRAEAERYARAFRDRGYAAEVVSVNLPGKGTWHRVYVGRFKSRTEAEKAYRELKARKLIKTAYIKKVSR